MLAEKQIRSLLGPADPARFVTVPPAPVPAAELIRRAEATPEVQPDPARRRLRTAPRRRVLVAAATGVVVAAAAAAAVAYPLTGSSPEVRPPSRPPITLPLVVEPMAYEETTDPEPAADHLRELAAEITDTPYDGASGDYSYHHLVTWGEVGQGSPDGHYMSYVEEYETWTAGDGSGRQRQVVLAAQFPDEESRRYYEAAPNPDLLRFPQESVGGFEPGTLRLHASLAEKWAEMAEVLGTARAGEFVGEVEVLYREWVVPRETRAAALQALAEVPGVVWRGEVTDRAGRPGVAVSYDLADEAGTVPITRTVLVFDPQTGELLSSEWMDLRYENLNGYRLYLETGWTDERGPEPTY